MNSTTINNDGIVLRIEADYIYKSNTASLEFTSKSSFTISLKSKISVIEISKGQFDQKLKIYKAEEKDGVFTVKLLTLGLFHETLVQHSDQINEAVNSYGMQFFPFISSKLLLKLNTLTLPIKTVILTLPDSFRIVWYRRKVLDTLRKEAEIYHSYSQAKASFIFDWKKKGNSGEYDFDIPLRLGGSTLWLIVEFPRNYFYVALFAIAVASFQEQISILLAAIIAAWLFLMGHWAKINMPQQNTIATRIYFFFLFATLSWGLMWKIHWLLGGLAVIIIGVIVKSFKDAVEMFSQEALLPPLWEKLFYKLNDRRDKKNRSIFRLQKPYEFIEKAQSFFTRKREKRKVITPDDKK